ncbi:MAG: DUF5407 family protein [Chlamydiales bacterium]
MSSGGGGASFNVQQMIAGMNSYVNNVKQYLSELEKSSSGTVNLGTMFNMQFHMQIMSQYIEAVSNTLSAIHNEMMTMARAVKGQ